MNSAVSDHSDQGSDLEAAAWLFEQLAVDAGETADRPRIRRALEEAASAWPAGPEDRWWKWLVEAGQSLGLKCRIVDCTFEQVTEVARDGGRLITRVGEERQWKAIGDRRGRSFHLLRPLRDRNRLWVGQRKLRSLLQFGQRDDLLRFLVIEPRLRVTGPHSTNAGAHTPLDRLRLLLRPEAGDIWIILLFALVTGLLTVATPLAVETLVNTVAFGRLLQPVVVLALMLLAFLSFSASLRALQTWVVEILQQRLFARVAADLAYRLPRVEIASLDGQSGRELVNRFFDVVTVQKVAAQLLLDGVSLVLGGLVGMAVLAFYHPWLLGFDIVLLALVAFVILVLGRGAISSSIKESKMKYRMASWLEDLSSCPTAFRHGGAGNFAVDRADNLVYDYLTARKAHFRVLMRQVVFALGMQAVASTVLLGLGGWLVISGQLTLGQLVAAELIVTVIVGSFAKLGKHVESYYDLLAAVDKLGTLFDLPMERQDGLLNLPEDRPACVLLNRVTCADGVLGTLLKELSLQIESGERVMLTGSDGAAGSRLLDLLFGTRAPSAGHIAIDGLEPRDMRPDALRRHVALLREVELFNGTVLENVHLERPEVSTSHVRDALEQVGLIDIMMQLPDGLETVLTGTGYPLSTNQARLLMAARAIVGRPRLLLVDGLIDALPDHDAERLTRLLVDPDQPWTLLMVTGRRDLAEAGTRTVSLPPRTPVEQTLENAYVG